MENQSAPRNEDFQIFLLLERYLKYWPWFALSVILCCMLAVLYIKSSPKQYMRTASVQILDNEQNQDITAAFSDRSQLRSYTNVNNEIEAFRSPQLVQEVVRRLKLDISYVTKEGLRSVDMYTQSPIIAVFPGSHESEAFSFRVKILPGGRIELSNFVVNQSNVEQSITTDFNKETATPAGNMMISPSLYYLPNQNYAPVDISKNDINSVAIAFSKSLNVELSGKLNTVIGLNMEDVSIQRAEDFLNTLITVYQENLIAEKNKATVTTLSFLNERIAITAQELTEIDDRLARYKSRNLVTDIRSTASLQMQESLQYSGKIQDVYNQINLVRFIREYLNDNSKTTELLPNETGVNNPGLVLSINNYNDLLIQRNKLLTNSSAQNPVIIEMNNNLTSLRQSIIHTTDNLIAMLNLQLSGLMSQEEKMNVNIASNPGQERHLITLEREQNIKETLYLYLMQKREENEMSLIVTTSNSRIISPPSGEKTPVKPSRNKVLLLALFMGMGIPAGIIWGRDTLNTTIRNKKDLDNLTVPLLGVIPQTKKKVIPLIQEHGWDVVNESFRIVRTNLDFMCTQDTKVIQFISLESGTGKTFTALNLAMSFAIAGQKVALLDLDLRTASLSRLLGFPDKGISNMLNNGMLDESTFIKKDCFYPGFDIIPAGPVPVNPSELLMGDKLKMLIEKLKDSYDYVFIDSTPINLVADTAIVGKFADLFIFIVRENFTDRRKLPELENIYSREKTKNMCVVLNDSNTEISTGRYNAYYSKKFKTAAILPKS
ncbi:MAG: polysaccharide biosynthesis tyrosine autokinase [Bacteroidales bacterium]|jgi:capsular exopolysaccharide synthesis family protein|nr:polysaccharide biosynthesis tyrosine autokinase [Bacteroidales bacterium]